MLLTDLKKALLHSLLGKYALYVFQLLSMVVLARLIAPDVFGVVASLSVIAMFFQMLSGSGLTPAIVYQETFSEQQRNGVFSFTLLIGAVLGVLLSFCAPILHDWFGFEQGLFLFYSLGLVCFFSAIAIMPMASLLKDSKFLRISQAEMLAELIGFLICLGLLYINGNELVALGGRFLSVPALRFFFYFIFSRSTEIGRPKLGGNITLVTHLFSFAKFQILFNIVNYFSRNLDNLLIAKYFGATALGVYEKTYQVMRYPLQLFTFAITPALQPVLTKYKDQPEQVYDAYFKVVSRLAVVGVFSAVMLYLTADHVVFILFGDKWMSAAPYLQVLALSVPVQMVMSSTGGVFQAFGQVKPMFICGFISSVITVSAICYGVYTQELLLLCKGIVLAFYINYIICMIFLKVAVFRCRNDGFYIVTSIILLTFTVLFLNSEKLVVIGVFESILQVFYTLIPVSLVSGLLFLFLAKFKK